MARTTAELVKGVLLDEYGRRADRTMPDLAPFINAASMLTTRVATCAAAKDEDLSDEELEMLERWLSAHAFKQSDQAKSSKSVGGASSSFQGQTGMYLEGTKYGQMALLLDPTGCLYAMTQGGTRAVASAQWLGKKPREQRPWDQ